MLYISLERETYGPERNAMKFLIAAMSCSKVVCISFAGLSGPVAVANCVREVLLQDMDAVSHWTVDTFWELAIRITDLSVCNFEVGEGGRRDSGGTEGESDDGFGVHVENLRLVRIVFLSSNCWYGGEGIRIP